MARGNNPPTAPPPADRVQNAAAFQITGVDFAGPVILRDNSKAWIALFTCAVYHAAHLELVTSISTETFLLAFHRLIEENLQSYAVTMELISKELPSFNSICLFRGSARRKEFLKAVGITHVLNTADGKAFGQVNTGADYYADSNIKYMGLDLIDVPRTRIIDYFGTGINFIDQAVNSGGKILVHCLMGLSRSATIVAAYLMVKKNMTAVEALHTIRKQREVRPNDGFLVQLLQLEAKGLEGK
ncbi:dual specificity protein phosphatase 3-like [Stegodyphus dumicola]|uniref:dual specificity protein phosphatase 3-like n=1 Tax=Stegodyphus dumicola TaxID=202533 RepID=UPI0015B12E0E|nr:dual specificity protein phosphatase 3-like [Stegodyphus dumicola]